MNWFKKDIFGNIILIKKWFIIIIGIFSYRRIHSYNTSIIGTKNIKHKSVKNVLFVSNHQTYFLDAIAIIHVLNATINGNKDSLKNFAYLFKPKLNTYYVAAKETMKNGYLPKILSYTGSILIKRSWRENGQSINRPVNENDINKIKKGLKDGWVITFPQGTTKKNSHVRDGTSYLIKENKPIVIPIRIDGFNKKFEKKSLKIQNKSSSLSIQFKKPIKINYEMDSINSITKKITKALELPN